MTSRQHDPHVREAILALYSKGQQDGAPAHTANMAQEWCQNNFRAIENGRFWPKSYWPPCSPDLNVMDFAICWHKRHVQFAITILTASKEASKLHGMK